MLETIVVEGMNNTQDDLSDTRWITAFGNRRRPHQIIGFLSFGWNTGLLITQLEFCDNLPACGFYGFFDEKSQTTQPLYLAVPDVPIRPAAGSHYQYTYGTVSKLRRAADKEDGGGDVCLVQWQTPDDALPTPQRYLLPMYPKNVKAILYALRPQYVKTLQSFMGLINFYWKFIPRL
ncbi:hypothetical protein MRX96_027942 [Rhipicephalus microplus]